ncbi:MarC family protein [Phenylobacterium sp.]|jgi:multiple antibiotic resistance protein|uniref:MarC family protein n=1 Tax=Phenylobacterium sp. TaxID=1871053 RepID=UPI0037C64A59
MSQAEFAVNFFVALFALIDPIGNVPLFAAATGGVKWRERAWIALYLSLFVLGFLTFFYFTGLSLLEFFGISLPAFKIAGGVILFLMGLEMARDDFSAKFSGDDGDGETGVGMAFVRKRFERMIVPFAMPLLIGPGAISSVIIYADKAKAFGLAGAAVGLGVIGAVSLATLLSFLATPILTRILGRIGLTVVVRVLGLILCALAIQFVLAGLADSTSGFIRSTVAHPY